MPLLVSTCVFVLIDKQSRADIGRNVSWETVFTADFELDVLRGKRPYRWTIWVSLSSHMVPNHRLNENSYTLEPATLAYLPSSFSSLIWMAQGSPVT